MSNLRMSRDNGTVVAHIATHAFGAAAACSNKQYNFSKQTKTANSAQKMQHRFVRNLGRITRLVGEVQVAT